MKPARPSLSPQGALVHRRSTGRWGHREVPMTPGFVSLQWTKDLQPGARLVFHNHGDCQRYYDVLYMDYIWIIWIIWIIYIYIYGLYIYIYGLYGLFMDYDDDISECSGLL